MGFDPHERYIPPEEPRLWLGFSEAEAREIYDSLRLTQHEAPAMHDLLGALRRFLGMS